MFYNSTETSKTVYELKQWNTAIIVYMDTKLPKSIRQLLETLLMLEQKKEICILILQESVSIY